MEMRSSRDFHRRREFCWNSDLSTDAIDTPADRCLAHLRTYNEMRYRLPMYKIRRYLDAFSWRINLTGNWRKTRQVHSPTGYPKFDEATSNSLCQISGDNTDSAVISFVSFDQGFCTNRLLTLAEFSLNWIAPGARITSNLHCCQSGIKSLQRQFEKVVSLFTECGWPEDV
jgi:hypothetical protein